MTYKELKSKARKEFLEKFPNYEVLLIWDNRQVLFGKMLFNVRGRNLEGEIIEEMVIVDV